MCFPLKMFLSSVHKGLKDPSKALSTSAGLVTRSPSPEDAHNRTRSSYIHDRVQWMKQSADEERKRRGWPAIDEVDELGRRFAPIRSNPRHDAGASDATAQGMFVGQSLQQLAAGSPGGRHVNPSAIDGSGPAPDPQAVQQKLVARFAEPEVPQQKRRQPSPRLHSLPDNTLNPLGLLAEASLHNHHRIRRQSRHKGVADDNVKSALHASSANSNAGSASSPASNTTGGAKSGADGSPAVDGVKVETDSSSPTKQPERAASTHLSETSAAGTGGNTSQQEQHEETTKAPESQNIGVASDIYFKPGPMTILPLRKIVIERELAPELLTQGIVSSEEVLELFRIFFLYCGQHVVMFDPEWHTPTMICGRSPFLFTVICTIASKFYKKKPELHKKCLEITRKSAYVIMSRGFKSVEIVQGLLLLSLWPTPSQRFEEDKTWLYSGVAIRMATDLNLHRKSMATLPGHHDPHDPVVLEREREIINRERTWLLCFSVDRSISGQMGKPWTIREDWIIRNSRHWGLQRLSKPWDLGLSALVELMRIMTRQFDFLFSSTTTVSGLNNDIDYNTTLRIFNEQLQEWYDTWHARGFFTTPYDNEDEVDPALRPATHEEKNISSRIRDANFGPPPDIDEDHNRRTTHFISKQAPLRYNYAVLLLNSFGLQHAVDFPTRSGLDKGIYFSKCFQAAKNMLLAAREGLLPVLAYSPDTHYVLISYACVFLLKLTRPVFAGLADEEEIISIVSEFADLLQDVAMDATHTPALYASFLRALLQARLDRSTTNRSGATTPYRSGPGSPIDPNEDMDKVNQHVPSKAGISSETQTDSATNINIPAHLYAGMPGAGVTNFTAEHAALLHSFGQSQEGSGSANGSATNPAGVHVDHLLNESFWSTLLPPGFGGPLDGLATGSVEMYPTETPAPNLNERTALSGVSTPLRHASGASTPSMVNMFGPNVSTTINRGGMSKQISGGF